MKKTDMYLAVLDDLEHDLANNEISLDEFTKLAQDYKKVFNI